MNVGVTEREVKELLEKNGYDSKQIDTQTIIDTIETEIEQSYSDNLLYIQEDIVGLVYTLRNYLEIFNFNSVSETDTGFLNKPSVPISRIRKIDSQRSRNSLYDILSDSESEQLKEMVLQLCTEISSEIHSVETYDPSVENLTEENRWYTYVLLWIDIIEGEIQELHWKSAGVKFNKLPVTATGNTHAVSYMDVFSVVESQFMDDRNGNDLTIELDTDTVTVDQAVYNTYLSVSETRL